MQAFFHCFIRSLKFLKGRYSINRKLFPWSVFWENPKTFTMFGWSKSLSNSYSYLVRSKISSSLLLVYLHANTSLVSLFCTLETTAWAPFHYFVFLTFPSVSRTSKTSRNDFSSFMYFFSMGDPKDDWVFMESLRWDATATEVIVAENQQKRELFNLLRKRSIFLLGTSSLFSSIAVEAWLKLSYV